MSHYTRVLITIAACVLVAGLLVGPASPVAAAPDLPAFPGAEGFGSTTPGGRGGRVIYVTNLQDSGPGSLREALAASGPRIILFKVGGTLLLEKDLVIAEPYVTIAGHTAPGEGVQIRGAMIKIQTHDVVIRYLKVRSGDEKNGSAAADRDAISLSGTRGEVYNVVIDHCSLVWGPDMGGLAVLVNVHDVVVQYTIMGEGLYLSNHPEGVADQGGHSLAVNISELTGYDNGWGRRITLHHNLLTTSDHRMPQILGTESAEVINNVIYNWGGKGPHGNPRSLHLLNNVLVRGPETTSLQIWTPENRNTDYRLNAVYEAGNLTQGFTGTRGGPASVYTSSPIFPSSNARLQDAQQAYQAVTQEVGARIPVLDEVDQRILQNLVNRTGRFFNGVDAPAPNITWPTLRSGQAPADTDSDGMPNGWETAHQLSPDRDDSAQDRDGDGYTNIEEYLNELAGVGPSPQPTFADVAPSHPYFLEIEALYRAGYTAGCGTNPLMFCPDATMNRAESAVFVERGIHAASFQPPAPSSQIFADVPLDGWAASWINAIWQDQFTQGCGTNPLTYCPWQGHTRAEGAVFYLRMLNGADFVPPPPSQQLFADVPLDAWYAAWMHAGYGAGILPACQTSPNVRLCPEGPLTRGLAAYMMVQAKGLSLEP